MESIDARALELGGYIAAEGATVRAAAARYGVSKSTVHKDVTVRLRALDLGLWERCQTVLALNKAERHLRGGEATREKYRRK
ncbi:MAG: sporulation transcriptional regulator SpoIIID [bacterium]